MKAITYTKYGAPNVLQITEMPKPIPKGNEVLVRIHATTVTAVDYIYRAGKPFVARLDSGIFKPKKPVLGTEFSGEIEAIGAGVKKFKVGDKIFASSGPTVGTYAEYKCMPEDGPMAILPNNMGYEEATAVPYGALTALPFLRDSGNVQAGQKVLIYGASGSVGTYAVQLAAYMGAEVTGVCSSANLEWVKSLGAHHVIDYTKEDFCQNGETYDVIFDTVGKISFPYCKHSLNPQGIFLTAYLNMGILRNMLWTSLIGGKKAAIAFTGLRPSHKKAEDLIFLKGLIENGKLTAIIDRTYPMEAVADAHAYVEKGHKKGNVVLTIIDA